MLSGLITLSVATITMSSALFTRRSRSGWLDELDGIRGDALTDPRGEVDGAMAAFEALANEEVDEPSSVSSGVPERNEPMSPLSEVEAPLSPAAPAPATNGHHREHPEGPATAPEPSTAAPSSPDMSTLPPPPSADRSTLSPPPPPGASDRSTLPSPPPPRSTAAPADDPGSAEPAPEPPRVTPSPHPVRPHEMWHPEVLPTAPLANETVQVHRGAEHAPTVPSSTSTEVDGHGEPDATPPRFRFARLRAVLPGSDDGDVDDRSAPASDSEAHPSLLSELLASYGEEDDGHAPDEDQVSDGQTTHDAGDGPSGGFDLIDAADVEGDGSGTFDAPDGPAGRPAHLDHGDAPLVPTSLSVGGQALINGPVNRRTPRDEEFVRRRDLSAVLEGQRPAGTGTAAPSTGVDTDGYVADRAASTPPNAPTEHGDGPGSGDHGTVEAGDHGTVDAQDRHIDDGSERTVANEETPAPTIGDPVDERVPADPAVPEGPTDGPIGTVVEPVDSESVGSDATAPFVREALVADPDGVVELASGHLRFGDGDHYEVVSDEAAVEIGLVAGSCWAALEVGAAKPVIVAIPAGELVIPPGSTALAVVEPGADVFVVIVAGEATLEHPGGRMRLRLGAMVLASPGREPQVDVASVEEIAADPAVAANLALDAAR